MNTREQLLAAVERSRLSERRLSVLATGSSDTLRNIRKGAHPRVDTAEAFCRVLGLEIQIGPALLPPKEDGVPTTRPPTEFSGSRELPVYEWADPSEEGYLRRPDDATRAPAPVDLRDTLAFYARMPDTSMVPARVGKGDFCLISPCAQLQVDDRAWFRARTGRETIRWVTRLSETGYDLGAWHLDEAGHQAPRAVHWRREHLVDRGVVVSVYRERPTATKPLQPRADWRPDSLAELWRSAQCNKALATMCVDLDQAVSVLEEAEMKVRRLAGKGSISDFHAELLLRVLDHRLQASLGSIRSSLLSNTSDDE